MNTTAADGDRIQSVYALEALRAAYDELADGHTRAKVMLSVAPDSP